MHKNIIIWVALTLMIRFVTTFVPTAPASAAETNARLASRATICKGQSIPSGYVITSETRTSRCPSISIEDNAWVIETPGSREVVCKGSPIPSGYVITEERRQYRCPSISIEDNAWLIKRL
ncbi:MAG: hypothetical protein AAGF95_28140 [Chloroflexota bacterium]